MRLTLTINMDNAAFGETDADRAYELASILSRLCDRFSAYDGLAMTEGQEYVLADTNGNRVGIARIDGAAQ